MIVIDARIAAMEIAKIIAYDANMENAVAGYHYTKDDFMDVAKEMLGNVPMLEAEPVRCGRWINTGSGQECSICHEIQYGYDNYRHYCSHCGAQMRNEE